MRALVTGGGHCLAAALSLLGRQPALAFLHGLQFPQPAAGAGPPPPLLASPEVPLLPGLAQGTAAAPWAGHLRLPQQLTNLRHFHASHALRDSCNPPLGQQLREFHRSETGLRSPRLGIVELLREDPAIHLPVAGTRNLWEVLEFHPDATVLETVKSPEVLALHPRDVYLFASDLGQAGIGGGQQATIVSREGAILFKTEVLRAIIYYDKAVLFPTRRKQDTLRIAQTLKSTLCHRSPLPFELKVLESLLAETSHAFESKSRRLGMVAETVLNDINASFHSSAGELQRLIPIQRKLLEVQNDIKETLEAIADVVNYDDAVQALCLTERQQRIAVVAAAARAAAAAKAAATADDTGAGACGSTGPDRAGSAGTGGGKEGAAAAPPAPPPPLPHGPALQAPAVPGRSKENPRTPHMRMASAILESYEFKMQGAYNSIKEMLESLEHTRTVWHMQLDHQRNRVLRINLLSSVMSFGLMLSTVPAAYFGMNLSSGLEEVPGIFWPVIQYSMLTGGVGAGLMWAYFKWGPKRRYKARLRDMRSLRDLLMYHIDDLEEIIACVKQKGRVDRKEFTELVKTAVKGRPMSKDEVNLLYRVFDTNKDGFLEISELVRLEDHMAEALSKLPGPPGDDLM